MGNNMNTKKRLVAMTAAAVAAGTVLGGVIASEASAINRVTTGCVLGYSNTFSVTGNTCWANVGHVAVTLYTVSMVDVGGNHGIFLANGVVYSYSNGSRMSLPDPTITYIEID